MCRPDEVFEILEARMPAEPRRVLELGCGTGDLTLQLARRVDRLDAVYFSEAMLAVARSRPVRIDPTYTGTIGRLSPLPLQINTT